MCPRLSKHNRYTVLRPHHHFFFFFFFFKTISLALLLATGAAQVSVTTVESFDTSLATDGGKRGRAVWNAFRDTGSVAAAATTGTGSAAAALEAAGTAATSAARRSVPGATLGAAVCQELAAPLAPGEARRLVFSLTWDAPAARFGSGRALPRRYTRYFGRGGRATAALAGHALASWRAWEVAVDAWQRPILDAPQLPSFYK